jgi:hypothetical protein
MHTVQLLSKETFAIMAALYTAAQLRAQTGVANCKFPCIKSVSHYHLSVLLSEPPILGENSQQNESSKQVHRQWLADLGATAPITAL